MLDPQVLSPYKGVDRAPLEALIRSIRIPPSWGWANVVRFTVVGSIPPVVGVGRTRPHHPSDRLWFPRFGGGPFAQEFLEGKQTND